MALIAPDWSDSWRAGHCQAGAHWAWRSSATDWKSAGKDGHSSSRAAQTTPGGKQALLAPGQPQKHP